MTKAQQVIFEQDVPSAVRRSAWLLYQHELSRINPVTCKPFSSQKALSNILRWISEQKSKRRRLTPMQRQILYLLAVEGLSQKEIAHRLGRDRGTIKLRFAQIRQRLGVTSMYQVVVLAVQHGWIRLPQVEK